MLVNISGVRSWVTATLVVPHINYGKLCIGQNVFHFINCQFYRYAHYDNNPSFSDFNPFGGWSKPSIKQYSADRSICGAGVDLNYY